MARTMFTEMIADVSGRDRRRRTERDDSEPSSDWGRLVPLTAATNNSNRAAMVIMRHDDDDETILVTSDSAVSKSVIGFSVEGTTAPVILKRQFVRTHGDFYQGVGSDSLS